MLSKSHKKILKTLNRFLKDGVKGKDGVSGPEGGDGTGEDDKPVMEKEYLKSATRDLPPVKMETQKEETPSSSQQSEANNTYEIAAVDVAEQKQTTKSDQGNPKKKKLMRLERRQAKLASKGLSVAPLPANVSSSSARKTLEEFLNEEPKDGKHTLKVKLSF